MSSVNHYPTFQYIQPEEYRFSHDSVFLARYVFEREWDKINLKSHVLDICSGCGIVGLDFLWHLRNEKNLWVSQADFLEIQLLYKPYFKQNVVSSNLDIHKTKISFINENYNSLSEDIYKNRYNLIVANPPYFEVSQGKLSPSEFKNRCRFFIDSDLKNLIHGILHALKSGGSAYILLRSLRDHGVDSFKETLRFKEEFEIYQSAKIQYFSIVTTIRGTDVLYIKK